MATWFQGTADEFIRVSREGWDRGVSILHFLGGTSIEVAAHRAVAQTKMTISQRARVHDVLRCRVHGTVLRFLREAGRTMGTGPAATDL